MEPVVISVLVVVGAGVVALKSAMVAMGGVFCGRFLAERLRRGKNAPPAGHPRRQVSRRGPGVTPCKRREGRVGG